MEPVAPTQQDSRLAAEAAVRLSDGQLSLSGLPDVAVQLLSRILNELANGHALTVTPFETDMTTSEAADYLNVSRPYLVRLLDEGKIPFRRVGTHRRVYFDDIKAYKQKQDTDAYTLLAELQAEAQELKLGY
jgi:excisionase family DNA binding protein